MKLYLAVVISFIFAVPVFAQERCEVGPDDFSVEKSSTDAAFYLNYRGVKLYTLSGHTLAHPVYGGEGIDFGCGSVTSSDELIVWTLGHKRDLLVAFGVIRENGAVKGVSRLIWFPHDGTFDPLTVQPNHEIFVQHGRDGDLASRICWNSIGDNKWRFSFRRDAPNEPCNLDPAAVSYGAKSRVILIGRRYTEQELGG